MTLMQGSPKAPVAGASGMEGCPGAEVKEEGNKISLLLNRCHTELLMV